METFTQIASLFFEEEEHICIVNSYLDMRALQDKTKQL